MCYSTKKLHIFDQNSFNFIETINLSYNNCHQFPLGRYSYIKFLDQFYFISERQLYSMSRDYKTMNLMGDWINFSLVLKFICHVETSDTTYFFDSRHNNIIPIKKRKGYQCEPVEIPRIKSSNLVSMKLINSLILFLSEDSCL